MNHKNLEITIKRRVKFECDATNIVWISSGRHLRYDMKLTIKVKILVEFFLHDTRASPNSRYVLKLRVGSKIRDPHPKHLTQTELFKKKK